MLLTGSKFSRNEKSCSVHGVIFYIYQYSGQNYSWGKYRTRLSIYDWGFYWFKKCTGISGLSSCCFFILGGQPLPNMSEKSPFVRAGCFSKSHTVPTYYTKDKRTWSKSN